jgi:ribosomal protein S18 acetylase RimI-like enzyme
MRGGGRAVAMSHTSDNRPKEKENAVRIRVAEARDVEALSKLINAAFLPEKEFIEGDRITVEGVRSYMAEGKILVTEDSGALVACVYVESRGERGYLGLLGVEPHRQGTGLSRRMMDAAENHFREAGCRAIDLRVISARTALPAYYRHLGYLETGTAEIPAGAPLKVPCHYIEMSKSI